MSIGLTAFLVFVAFLVYFTRKKLRKSSEEVDISKDTGSSRISQEIKPVYVSGLHEADTNSLSFQRELPDSGKVELLDGNSPSGSGNKISEMPQSPSPTPLCELGTRHTSLATSSLRRQSDRNRNVIFYSTSIWRRESSDSSGALKESPCVETKISSSPRPKSLETARSLPTPPQLTPEYLNRALPSTPDSDSTQDSLAKTSSSSPHYAANCVRSPSSRTSINLSDSGTAPSDTALDMLWDDYDMSWETHRRPEPSLLSSSSTDIKIMMPKEIAETQIREYPSLSSLSLSTDVELVVPPGTPKSQVPSGASIRKGDQRPRGNFF